MAAKFLVLAACVTIAACAEYYNHPILAHKPHGYLRPAYRTPVEKEALIDAREHHVPAHYKYEYGVHDPYTGDVKSQQELREGDLVKGYYTLNEPDGTQRLVRYNADPYSGFNADVERAGHAIHPVPVKSVPVPVKRIPVPVKSVVVPVKTVPVPVKTVPVSGKALYPYGYERAAAPVAYEDSYY